MKALHLDRRATAPTSGKEWLNAGNAGQLHVVDYDTVICHAGAVVAIQKQLEEHVVAWLRKLVPELGTFDQTIYSPGRTAMKRWTAAELLEVVADAGPTWLASDVLELLGVYWPAHAKQLRAAMAGPGFSGVSVKPNSVPALHVDEGHRVLVVLRSGATQGGELALPELGVRLAVPDATLVLLDGANWSHGTTPLTIGPGGGSRTAFVLWP